MRRCVIVLVVAVLSRPIAGSAQASTPHVQVGDSIRVLALGSEKAGEVTLLRSGMGCVVGTVAHVRGAGRGSRTAMVNASLTIEHRARGAGGTQWVMLTSAQLRADSIVCIEMRFR
jgi:hypothetical protein